MSEPVRIGKILPEVLQNIERRCEQNQNNRAFNPIAREHGEAVRRAVRGFMLNQKSRRKNRIANNTLFDKVA